MGMQHHSDAQLMALYQIGTQGAFEEIYSRFSGKVYGFLRNRVRNDQIVEDVFQITFQKLHQNRQKYNSKFALSAWIFTICRNALYDELRKKQRSKETMLDTFNDLVEKTAPDNETSHEISELEKLPDSQKEAVRLRYYEDLSFDEIAERLNTSSTNARQLVSRAVRLLKKLSGSSVF